MDIRKTLAAGIAAIALTLPAAGAAWADTYLGSYQARLSRTDHFASDGYRLDTAAQVVRQDRANFHKFGNSDYEDEDDPWFGSTSSRARFEQMLNKSSAMNSATRSQIMNGQPIVQVDVYRSSVRVQIVGY